MKHKILPYNQKLVPLARKLRNNSTLSEVLLWRQLKRKQVLGYDFDRQRRIGNYIVDFNNKDLMLAVEIDGRSHDGNGDYDWKRERELEALGVSIIRFDDEDVKKDMEYVIKVLKCRMRKLEGRYPAKNPPLTHPLDAVCPTQRCP